MRIDAGLDTGDILMQREMAIGAEDTAETVGPRLAGMGAALMVETLGGLESGSVRAVAQDDSLATLAPILRKEDGRMDFSRSAQNLLDRLRGFQPWPGAFTSFKGKTLSVHRARVVSARVAAGEILVEGGRLLVGCGDGASALELLEVQVEGKRRVPVLEFTNGYRLRSGDILGQ
jgi:methionyl-tRNA formyltransferase